MHRHVHPVFGQVNPMWTGRNISELVKNEGAYNSSKPIDTDSYALRMGDMYVCNLFRVMKHITTALYVYTRGWWCNPTYRLFET